MRSVRLIVATVVVATTAFVVTACTPEAQNGIGTTIAQIIGLWLWVLAHPAGSL